MDENENSRLDWIEQAGIENMKTHHVSADNLAKDSGTTLTLLLAGMAGGLTYAGKGVQEGSWTPFTVGAAASPLGSSFSVACWSGNA
jgi:hypothetical protein